MDNKTTGKQEIENVIDYQENETESVPSRREVLKKIAMGGTIAVGASSLPPQWTKPIVDKILVPAHAQTSPIPTTQPPANTTRPPATTTPPPATTIPPPAETGNIVISEILWRQTASADPNILIDEYVEIRNNDRVPIQLANWQVADSGPNFTFTFPNHVIEPGDTCRVFTHYPVAPNNTHPCQFTFGRTSPGAPGNYIWNNGGDTASLYDSTSSLVDSCSYSASDPSPFSC